MKNSDKFIKTLKLDKAAIRLFKFLERENPEVKNFLIKSYKGLPVSPETEEITRNYFITHSIFTAATVANPATSVITELLYKGVEKLNLPSPIDQYFLHSKAGRSIKARLKAIKKELHKIIEEYRQKGEVLIGNLVSGPGKDVIDILSAYYRNGSDVKAVHIDKDEFALEKGKRIAKIKGVNHLIDFIKGNFLKYNSPKKFDIVLLIGILCPLDFKTCVAILKNIKRFFKKDGCLIAGNVSKKMLKEDPFTYFLMEKIGNWKLVFKEEEELKEIFQKAGYEWKRCFTDPYGFNIMGVGIPRYEKQNSNNNR